MSCHLLKQQQSNSENDVTRFVINSFIEHYLQMSNSSVFKTILETKISSSLEPEAAGGRIAGVARRTGAGSHVVHHLRSQGHAWHVTRYHIGWLTLQLAL